MQRKKRIDKVRRLRGDKLHEFEPLRQQCARWALDNLDAIKATDPSVPDYLGDRARDNWRTLLAIAETAGWTEATLIAIRQLTPEKTEDDDYGVKLLADIKEIFKNDGRDRMPSADIVDDLNEMEESYWPGFSHGKGISAQRMANMLGKYKIKPYVQRTEGSKKTLRGYKKEDFTEIWSLYLPDPYDSPHLDVTAQQRSNGGASSDFTDVTREMDVTPGNGLEPPPDKGCYTVTPENRDMGHVRALEDDSERLRELEAEYQDMPKDQEEGTDRVLV